MIEGGSTPTVPDRSLRCVAPVNHFLEPLNRTARPQVSFLAVQLVPLVSLYLGFYAIPSFLSTRWCEPRSHPQLALFTYHTTNTHTSIHIHISYDTYNPGIILLHTVKRNGASHRLTIRRRQKERMFELCEDHMSPTLLMCFWRIDSPTSTMIFWVALTSSIEVKW